MTLKKWFLTSAAFCLLTPASWAGKELLIRAKDATGKPTALFEKVVVSSSLASIYIQPDDAAKNDPIEPYSIFFKLKTDNGKDELPNWVRVGDSEGKPFGWIRKKDRNDRETLSTWNTRFVLEPVDDPKRVFFVLDAKGERATIEAIPEGRRRFALVTTPPEKDKGEDTKYPVLVYTGKVQSQKGALQLERNKLDDIKLEVVFVVENTPGMVMFKSGETNAWESAKQLIRDTVFQLDKDPEIKKAVRYGLVEFQDDVKGKTFSDITNIKFPLTNESAEIISLVNTLQNQNFNSGDWPEDGLAGINKALGKELNWSENSSKHVIFISASSVQIHPKGRGPDQFNHPEGTTDRFYSTPRTGPECGWNTSGLSIEQLINKARPQAGSTVERLRNAVTMHCILAGRDSVKIPIGFPLNPEEIYQKPKGEVGEYLVKKFQSITEAHIQFLLNLESQEDPSSKTPKPTPQQIEQAGKKIREGDLDLTLIFIKSAARNLVKELLNKLDRERAVSQYRQLAKNNGELDGIIEIMEPSVDSINNTRNKLKQTLEEAFKTFVKARQGKLKGSEELNLNNPVTNSIYRIVDAAGKEIKDRDSFSGLSSTRDSNGREVAIKKVLVSESEIIRLKSTFNKLYSTFKNKTKTADRQDVAGILNEMKQIIAETGAGEKFDADTKINEVITDLPLRSPVLQMSPKDIAVMTSDAFKDWLDRLDTAHQRCINLLKSNDNWLYLSEKAPYEKFTFLRLNELP